MAKLLVTFLIAIFATGTSLALSIPCLPVTLPPMPAVIKPKDRENMPIDTWHARGTMSISNAVVRGLDTLKANLTFNPETVKFQGDIFLANLEICSDYHIHYDFINEGNVSQGKGEGHMVFQARNLRISNIKQAIRYSPIYRKLQFTRLDDVVEVAGDDFKFNVTGMSINGVAVDGDGFLAASKEVGFPLMTAFMRDEFNANIPRNWVEQTITSFVASIFTRE